MSQYRANSNHCASCHVGLGAWVPTETEQKASYDPDYTFDDLDGHVFVKDAIEEPYDSNDHISVPLCKACASKEEVRYLYRGTSSAGLTQLVKDGKLTDEGKVKGYRIVNGKLTKGKS